MKRYLRTLSLAVMLLLAMMLPVQATQLDHITDAVGLLEEGQREMLEAQAREISEKYSFGVYAIVVDDYRLYADGDIYSAAEQIFEEYGLGMGKGSDGLLLLLSMEERDYCLLAYGDYAQYAFNAEGQDCLDDYFLDFFGSDSWYNGLDEYLTWSDIYLEAAQNGQPYSYSNTPMSESQRSGAIAVRVGIIFVVPLIIAGIYILILSSKMKSVAHATQAGRYISGDLKLSARDDIFTHTTRTQRKLEEKSSSHSSGKSTGTTGKF